MEHLCEKNSVVCFVVADCYSKQVNYLLDQSNCSSGLCSDCCHS